MKKLLATLVVWAFALTSCSFGGSTTEETPVTPAATETPAADVPTEETPAVENTETPATEWTETPAVDTEAPTPSTEATEVNTGSTESAETPSSDSTVTQ